MRSKSEVMIAELLYQYGIPFRYEEPLYIEGFMLGYRTLHSEEQIC